MTDPCMRTSLQLLHWHMPAFTRLTFSTYVISLSHFPGHNALMFTLCLLRTSALQVSSCRPFPTVRQW